MKAAAYNILGESDKRLTVLLQVIKDLAPDFLAIQEANHFSDPNNMSVEQFIKDVGLPYFEIALAGEYDYHVASFSRYPFKSSTALKGFRNACLETVIETEIGEISICNTHLTPYTEDRRLKEIKRVIAQQKSRRHKIVLGDLNSLSPDDGYTLSEAIQNESQYRKFTSGGKLQFKVIQRLKDAGYIDAALQLGGNHIATVPTGMNKDKDHGAMRLDYVLLSSSLADRLKGVEVNKNDLTDCASDHYPIIVELS